MSEPIHSHELAGVKKALHGLSHDIENVTLKLFEGFMKHKRDYLDQAEKLNVSLGIQINNLNKLILSTNQDYGGLTSSAVLQISNEMQKLSDSVGKIIGYLRGKIEDGVLFSDKAVIELKEFFTVAIDGLKNTHDLYVINNTVLADHIVNQIDSYYEVSLKYAEDHEERLIKGVCVPKSSVIYLLVLESLKDILRYTRNIALALTEK